MGISDEFIGSNIRKMRELRRLSQKHIAKKTGLTEKAISEIENGHTQARSENITLLSKAMDCDEIDMITGIKVIQDSVVSSVDSVLRAVRFPVGRLSLALFLLSGKEHYLNEYKTWQGQHLKSDELEQLSLLLREIRRFLVSY